MPGEVAAAPAESWFFGCSQCGKCCNSAPRLTLPELFHHQTRFVGCLGIRRRGQEVELFTHGFAFSSLDACPALLADGRCAIHDDRKPTVCSIVPLDATLPDAEQHAVLAERRGEARYFGADCIRDRAAPGFREVTRHLRVIDTEALELLARQRRELADEQLHWGKATARILGPELLDRPERVRALPEHGALTISLVPVLSVVAEASERARARVLSYVQAQHAAQTALIDAALSRKNPADRAETGVLRKLRDHNQTLRVALELATRRAAPPATELSAAVEAWLGLV